MPDRIPCLLLTLAILIFYDSRTHAQMISDYFNIDCGGKANWTSDIGLEYEPDDRYIQTGVKLQLEDVDDPIFSLRYFPEGRSKDCYKLPVKSETTYLLRAYFYPGNISNDRAIADPVDFNVTVNSNVWLSYRITADNRTALWVESMMYTYSTSELYLCLVKGEHGFPFMNVLEVRELNYFSYTDVREESAFLTLVARVNTGTRPGDVDVVRYPEDIYDRIWSPSSNNSGVPFLPYDRVENISSVPPVNGLPPGWFRYNIPPVKVLEDAWVGDDISSPEFHVQIDKVIAVIYIREIRSVNGSSSIDHLEMEMGVNSLTFNETLTFPETQLSIITPVSDDDVIITLKSVPQSKAKAMVSAFELFNCFPDDLSATYFVDKRALAIVQISFGWNDWQGDPCYPVSWNWLTCNAYGKVEKLLLSNSSISGKIPEEIGLLADLKELHMNNNSLKGAIPESFGSLAKLTILDLSNNDLSGFIPLSLLDYDNVTFNFEGNPKLCTNVSCEVPHPPPPTNGVPSMVMIAEKIKLLTIPFLLHLFLTGI